MLRAFAAAALAAVSATAAGAGVPGALDPSWGGDGRVTTVVTRGDPHLIHADLDSIVYVRGRIWLSGASSPPGPLHYNRPARGGGPLLIRYLADGRLDSRFGTHGILRGDPRRDGDFRDLELALPNGEILTRRDWWRYGSVPHGLTRSDLVLLRPDGRIDARFGRNGVALVVERGCVRRLTNTVRQPDGGLVGLTATCRAQRQSGRTVYYEVTRLLPSGRLDRSFGANGTASVRIGPQAGIAISQAQALAAQPDGKLVVVGTFGTNEGPPTIVTVVRFTRAGRLDRTFGANGVVRLPALPEQATVGGVLVRPDGNLVVAGCSIDNRNDVVLYRLDADGALDPTWGQDGALHLGARFFPSDIDCAPILPAPNGKIMVFGTKLLGRVNPDGSLDATFGSEGVVRIDRGDETAVLVQPDGKLLLASKVQVTFERRAYVLLRYLG
jgi:uncharacterized delta-60 repeat protein